MPIPPRPIPNHGPRGGMRAHRPGTSVPRKAMSAAVAAAQHLDWRAEVALLGEASASASATHHPRSAPLLGVSPGSGPGSPSTSGSGLRIVERMREVKQQKEREERAKEKEALAAVEDGASEQPSRTAEVSLEGLIAQSKGKREKRGESGHAGYQTMADHAATTATTLGFDFVPNPTVVALPDSVDPAPPGPTATCNTPVAYSPIDVTVNGPAAASDPTDTSALLSTSRDMKARAALLWGGKPASPSSADSAATPGSALPRTPCTPGLIPATGPQGVVRVVEDEDTSESDSDWEHISGEIEAAVGSTKAAANATATADDDDLDGIILLGDMDLEEVADAPTPGKPQRKVLSYAAALGRSGARRLDVIRA